MEPYELPEGTTDDDADAYVEHLSSRAAAKGNMGIVLRGNIASMASGPEI